LVERLAEGLGNRLHLERMALSVSQGRDEVSVQVWNQQAQRQECWTARSLVLAVPLAIGARLLGNAAPQALHDALAQQAVAPWLVANLQLSEEPLERPGAGPAWDNVAFGSSSLGYVRAQHQRLSPPPPGSPVILTAYHALPRQQRKSLLAQAWQTWAERVVSDLAQMHPDLPAKVQRVDLARHGHAMSIPVPGVRSSAHLARLRQPGAFGDRLFWAHADLIGYSVFEEAFSLGHEAGLRVAASRALKGRAPRKT
jgi:hypothetical protein